MKNKQKQRPTNMNPNDSDFVFSNKLYPGHTGTGQNYSAGSGLQSADQTSSNSLKGKSAADKSGPNTRKK